MTVKSKRTYTRAIIKGGTSVSALIRALQDVPDHAIVQSMDVEYDYTSPEPIPAAFTMEVEWEEH